MSKLYVNKSFELAAPLGKREAIADGAAGVFLLCDERPQSSAVTLATALGHV